MACLSSTLALENTSQSDIVRFGPTSGRPHGFKTSEACLKLGQSGQYLAGGESPFITRYQHDARDGGGGGGGGGGVWAAVL